MWALLIFKNLRSFVLTKFVLFLFIIVSQVVCIISSFAVAGMIDALTPLPTDNRSYSTMSFFVPFYHDNDAIDETDDNYVEIFDEKNKKYLYMGKMNEEAQAIIDNTAGDLELFYSNKYLGNKNYKTYRELKEKIHNILNAAKGHAYSFTLSANSNYQNDSYVSYDVHGGNSEWMKSVRSEYGDGNKVTISRNPYEESPYQNLKEGDMISINGGDYIVSEITERTTMPLSTGTFIDFLYSDDNDSIMDDFSVSYLTITLDKTADQSAIAEITETIMNELGDSNDELEIPQPPPLMEKQFNNMIYVLAIIIIMVVLLNVSRLYNYIMSTRKKALAIFSVCGASRLKIFTVYITEILITLLLSFAVGCAVFHFGLIGLISTIYPTFAAFFTPTIYLTIFGIYMGVGLIIMTFNIIPIINKSVNDLTKGG